MQDDQERSTVFYGRRRVAPVLVFGAIAGGWADVAEGNIVQAVFGLALSVWLWVMAWRYWRRPVPSPFEARRSEERRAWLGANPVRGALLSGVVIAAVLFATEWPKDRIVAGVVICGAFGGLIGLGLYFVFRTDPTFKPGSESLH